MEFRRLENLLQGRPRMKKSRPAFCILLERLEDFGNLENISWHFVNNTNDISKRYEEFAKLTKEGLILILNYRFSENYGTYRNIIHEVFFNRHEEHHYIKLSSGFKYTKKNGETFQGSSYKHATIEFLRNI